MAISGSQTLRAGDSNAGFYGEVPTTELITPVALASAIGLSAGVPFNTDAPWLKFAIDGKVIFVSKRPVRYGISWDAINAVGAALGTKTVNISGNTYKVRLIKGALTNPANHSSVDFGCIGSEWNRLMLPIHADAATRNWDFPNFVESNVPDWGVGYTDAELTLRTSSGNGYYTLCQETVNTDYQQRVGRGSSGVSSTHSTQSSNAASTIGWRPVLELVNSTPVVTVTTPTANQTLHENTTLTLAGNTTEVDIDDVVTIKYQIDSGTVRNLHSAVSDGATAVNFSKALTYKDGTLYDGVTAITSVLDKDVPHTVSIWAEDGNGGKSNIITRTFFVVPNRPPSVTINPIATQSDLINSNVINISGAVTDLDNNDVTVKFKINDGEEQQVYQGPPSAFTFNILLNDLKVGANTVIVKATDSYNTSGTKTLTINKTHNATAVNTAVARYQIQAPTGSAKSILLWIQRTIGNLGITAQVSMTNASEAENYQELNFTNSGIANNLREDEYAYQGAVEKEKIILKITYDRTDASMVDTIKQISGVLF